MNFVMTTTLQTAAVKVATFVKTHKKCQKGQFAVDIALGLAVVLIISAFIVLPGLRDLATNMMTDIKHWWTTTMTTKVFTAS